MTSLSQNTNNDIFAVGGTLCVSSSKEAMAIAVKDAIQTLEGELQLDVESGIPYQRTIWESSSKVELWKHFVKEKVLSFPFVENIISFDVTINEHKELHYTLTIQTDEEVVVVEQ